VGSAGTFALPGRAPSPLAAAAMAATLPAMPSPQSDPGAACGADAAAHEGCSRGMWAVIEEQLEDELDYYHATLEHMELRVEMEAKVLLRRSGRGGGAEGVPAVGGLQRSLCWHFLHEMTRRSQCPLQCFFQAMHALDDSLAVVPLEQPPENSHILPRAAAVWCIIAKSEGFQHITTSLQMVALCVSEFSKRLGTGVPPILAGDIEREELRLLRAGLPDLHEPTMLQWIDLVRERFNVVSRGRAGNVFPATAPWMHSVAALAMHSMPSSEELPPRAIVVALSGLALVAAGLLRADTLLPAYVTDARWRDALEQVLQGPEERLRDQDPPELEPRAAIAALEFATGVPIEEVRSFVPAVVLLVLGACTAQRQPQEA